MGEQLPRQFARAYWVSNSSFDLLLTNYQFGLIKYSTYMWIIVPFVEQITTQRTFYNEVWKLLYSISYDNNAYLLFDLLSFLPLSHITITWRLVFNKAVDNDQFLNWIEWTYWQYSEHTNKHPVSFSW